MTVLLSHDIFNLSKKKVLTQMTNNKEMLKLWYANVIEYAAVIIQMF